MLVQLSVGSVNTPILATIDATVSLLPTVYYIAFIVCIVLFYSNAIVGIVINAYQSMQKEFSEEDVHVRLHAAPPRTILPAALEPRALTRCAAAGRVRSPCQVLGGKAVFAGRRAVGVTQTKRT